MNSICLFLGALQSKLYFCNRRKHSSPKCFLTLSAPNSFLAEQGKVAVICLAGDVCVQDRKRLPVGMLDIGLPNHKTPLQLQVERLKLVEGMAETRAGDDSRLSFLPTATAKQAEETCFKQCCARFLPRLQPIALALHTDLSICSRAFSPKKRSEGSPELTGYSTLLWLRPGKHF